MGNCEETKACKPEKASSPPPEHQQTGVHAYPDWAAMQAYYGPRMAMPQYFNPAVASGHAPPPYMWGPPQHMMPPYTAMYTHGGIYAHPGVPLAASPMNIGSPAKSSGNSDHGLMTKLKGFDGPAMAIGIGKCSGDNGISHSGETGGSSEGSDGNTTEGGQNGGKRSREGSRTTPAEVGKTEAQSGQFFPTEATRATKKVAGLTVVPPNLSGKVVSVVLSANPTSELELKRSPSAAAAKISATFAMLPNEALLQNERELKRERRKQSNRESARRSRLRKQAEAEELAIKVESLTSENLTLKSEIKWLTDSSEKLKLQNAKLIEKLNNIQEPDTANLLSRVNGEAKVYENNNNPKLRQLLDASPRADAVAAG